MEVPKLLYKFRAPTIQDIINLSTGNIWFSAPDRFNDPFDCAYDVVLNDFTREQCIAILAKYDERNESSVAHLSDAVLKQQIPAGLTTATADALKRVGGVSCFSEVRDNLLLWGHYADGHKGFCLEFETSKSDLFSKARQVRYQDALPRLNAELFLKDSLEPVMSLLLTKAKCWEYEREWRIFHQEGQRTYPHGRAGLAGIYFGAKMPDEQIIMIASHLWQTDTKLFRMRLDTSRFELVAEPLPEILWQDYRGGGSTGQNY